MRNLKKFLALVLAMVMVAGATAMVSADFTDVAADNSYAAAINDLAVKGIVAGTSATTFNPDADVQRYQMALFIARATTGEVGEEANTGLWANGIVPFVDVTEYKGAIQHAFLNGIIKGRTDTTFDPAGNIAYVDALTMAVRALGYTDLEYPWGFYNKAVALGLTENVAVNDLYTTLDRAETAQVIYNMIYAERANSDVHFAAEFFDLDVVRTSDLFVITATPLQAYADGYEADADVGKGTFVGVQPLVNGVPSGEVTYFPVEKLGIEAKDVEDYLSYTVELVDYDATTGEFYAANIGKAPVKVYTDKIVIAEDAAGNATNKITIDGTVYNLVENLGGTDLKNELVAFSGINVGERQAYYLLEDKDGNVWTEDGKVATRVEFSGSTTKFYAVTDPAVIADLGGRYIITESEALALWGYMTDDVQYTKYATLTGEDIAEVPAVELSLFDDDANGLFDRAIVNPVFMSNFGLTYKKNIDTDAAKETCDYLVSELLGEDVEASAVTYSEELEAGTIFTFTINPITLKVNVVDTLELQTAKLTKVDRVTVNNKTTYKLTLGDTVYTAKDTTAVADINAIALTYDETTDSKLSLANLDAAKIFDIQDDWADYILTKALNKEYKFYAVGSYLIFAEPVAAAAVAEIPTEFVVLSGVSNGFNFGKIDLKVWADGVESVKKLHKFDGDILADFGEYDFGLFLGDVSKFYYGTIYAVKNTADGMTVLGPVNDETYELYKETVKVNGVNKKVPILEKIDLTTGHAVVNDNDTIYFDKYGIARYTGDGTELIPSYANRIRTSAKTVFYFIDYGTVDGEDTNKPTGNKKDTTVETYVGMAKDVSITLDEHTYILVDKIGYTANAPTQGATQLVIVVNALDHTFGETKVDTDKLGYFVGDEDVYVAQSAKDLGLEGYASDAAFYMFENGAYDIATGETFTVYAPVNDLEPGYVYEFDKNGVLIGEYDDNEDYIYESYNLEDVVDAYWPDATDIIIDALTEEGEFDIVVDGVDKYDYDGYKVKKVTLVNLGDDVVLNHNGGTANLTYAAGASYSSWDRVHNFFEYEAQMINLETYVVEVSDNELLIYVIAEQ